MAAESVPFGLIFDPAEMAQALDVGLDGVTLEHNTFGEGFLAEVPFEVACFPYAQHFITTSYPQPGQIVDEQGLLEAVREFAAEAH
jgi:hypothetical protein